MNIHTSLKGKPFFDDQCMLAFDLRQEAHLRWIRDRSRVNWNQFVCCQVRTSETYSEAKGQFVVDLETSNGLMQAARELMLLNRRLIVFGIVPGSLGSSACSR